MNDFILYCTLGWSHIINLEALDHLLFLAVLTVLYAIRDWKKVLVLITAFTIGHSLTLFLSTTDMVRLPDRIVEWLIPLTILITALSNLIQPAADSVPQKLKYVMALLFGLIHGMGFANSIRFMMASAQHLFLPLLSFNIGIELGQIAVVISIMSIGTLLVEKMGVPKKGWLYAVSGLAAGVALVMCIQRLSF